jgi:hypothetical protein
MKDQFEESIRSALDDIVAGERSRGVETPLNAYSDVSTTLLSDGLPSDRIATTAGRLVLAVVCTVLVVAGLAAISIQQDSTPNQTGALADDAASVAALIEVSRDQVGTSMGDRCEESDGRQVEQWFQGEVEPPPYIPVVRFDAAGDCTIGGWVSREQQFPQYEEYEHSDTGALGEQPILSLQYIYDETGTVIGEFLVEGPRYY